MAQHFYDTSAAIKHYRAELGTAKVDSLLADVCARWTYSSSLWLSACMPSRHSTISSAPTPTSASSPPSKG